MDLTHGTTQFDRMQYVVVCLPNLGFPLQGSDINQPTVVQVKRRLLLEPLLKNSRIAAADKNLRLDNENILAEGENVRK